MTDAAQWISIGVVLLLNAIAGVWWLGSQLSKRDTAIIGERDARQHQMQTVSDQLQRQIAEARLDAARAEKSVSALELTMVKQLALYPTKAEIRDMLADKFDPLAMKVEALLDELVRRGVQSTPRRGEL